MNGSEEAGTGRVYAPTGVRGRVEAAGRAAFPAPKAAPPVAWRYGLAALSVGAAVAIRVLLDPFIREGSPFLLFFGAVMVAALLADYS